MGMHNPPHPGEFISSVYLEPNDISGRELAAELGVATSTLSRVLKGSSAVGPEMALRLSKALGRTPESWLAMQYQYDLWRARQHVDLSRVGKCQADCRLIRRAPFRPGWMASRTRATQCPSVSTEMMAGTLAA